MKEEEKTPSEFRRTLGLLDATMIVSGSMIGSGIFIVSADMSRMVGSAGWMLALWILTGIITVFAALSYGELAGMMPKAGGQFVYIQRAFGNLVAFLFGWTVFSVIQTGLIAAVAVAFAKYTGYFFPSVSQTNILLDLGFLKISGAQVLAILSIVLLTFINSGGIKNGKFIQLVFTMAKIVTLFGLIILGLFFAKHGYLAENFQNAWDAKQMTKAVDGTISGTSLTTIGLILALGTAIIGPLFSSDAWYTVTFIAGEIKNPKRNIPLSLFLGTLIVTILYVLANLAYLNLLPLQEIMFAESDRVGTAAAAKIFGASAAAIMAGLIMVSTFGCNSGLILSGARVYYAMSKEALFFKKAGELNKNDVPGWALWAQCIWTCMLCLSGTYGDLLDYLVFGSLIFYIVTTYGVIVLRKKEPNAERPYKVPFYPITPILYIILASIICLILLYTKTENAGRGLLLILSGLPIYYYFKGKMVND
jgi:basic amino acid/polyamine antiporter, APA family